MNAPRASNRFGNVPIVVGYYVIIAAAYISSSFSSYRVWGLNWWGHLQSHIALFFVIAGVLVPPVVIWLSRRYLQPEEEISPARSSGSRYYTATTVLIIVCGLLFYIFRVKAHFLGDGLTSLSYLASDDPLLRSRELGESLLHIWLKEILPGDGRTAALLSFQLLSIASGIGFVLTVAVATRHFFETLWQRFGFILGMAAGGYTVLFFGYVEYYSVFCFSVALFAIVGLLVVRGGISRWWIAPPFALATLLHILGVTLLPAALYVLLHNSRLSSRLSRRFQRRHRIMVGVVVLAGAAALFWHFYQTNLFFRMAVVPLAPNRFTVGGYTLFSLKHILDFGNLFILLLPGVPLFLVGYFVSARPTWKPTSKYLLLVVVSTLGAAFIFDPKMGMPRDWNLFAFAGVPLALFCYYAALTGLRPYRRAFVTCLLMVTLGVLALGGRIATQNSVPSTTQQFRNYIALDPGKCAKAQTVLINYFEDQGDTAKAEAERRRWKANVREKRLFDSAYQFIRRGDCRQGISLMKQVIDLNPLWQDAWSNIAGCFMRMKQFDSAMAHLNVALAINPYDAATLRNRGVNHLYKRNFGQAEDDLLASIALDNSAVETHRDLIALYKHQNKPDKLLAYLKDASQRTNSPMVVYKELGDTYMFLRMTTAARAAYEQAVSKGLDSGYVRARLRKH